MAINLSTTIISAAGNEISQSSTGYTVGATAVAGKLLVLAIAIDNLSTTDGVTNDVTSVSDTQLNTWNKAGEFTNTVGGVAGDGATIAVFYSVLTTQLTTSDTVTVNYSGNVTAKARASLRSFTLGAGSSISIAGTVQTLANDNANAGSMTISGLSNGEYLFVRAIASETDTSGISVTTNYTTLGSTTSGTGGSEKGHMAVDGEFRIVTATGDTSAPTMTDTTADRASLYIAFQEVGGTPPPPPGNTTQFLNLLGVGT